MGPPAYSMHQARAKRMSGACQVHARRMSGACQVHVRLCCKCLHPACTIHVCLCVILACEHSDILSPYDHIKSLWRYALELTTINQVLQSNQVALLPSLHQSLDRYPHIEDRLTEFSKAFKSTATASQLRLLPTNSFFYHHYFTVHPLGLTFHISSIWL